MADLLVNAGPGVNPIGRQIAAVCDVPIIMVGVGPGSILVARKDVEVRHVQSSQPVGKSARCVVFLLSQLMLDRALSWSTAAAGTEKVLER